MRIIATLWLIPIVLGLATHGADAKPKLAVLGLEVVGAAGGAAATAIADELTDALRSQVRIKGARYTLGPGTDVALAAAKAEAKCKTERPACLTKIAANLGVDNLMFGRIERTDGAYRISLRLFNATTRRFVRAYATAYRIADLEGAELRAAAKEMYDKVTTP